LRRGNVMGCPVGVDRVFESTQHDWSKKVELDLKIFLFSNIQTQFQDGYLEYSK